jgi:membrane-bound inhibitor of C-type lysozyme
MELFPSQCGAEQKWLSFRCLDGQTVMAQFQLPQDQFVNVHFAGRELRLPHVISGSGARYSDGKTTFWNRGRSVLVEVDDKIVVQDCMLEGKPQG